MRAPLSLALGTLLLLSMFVSAPPAAAQDTDGDTIPDASDNCLTRANTSQVDTPDFVLGRNDGFGNACDADWVDNGVVNAAETSLLKQHYLHNNQAGENEIDVEISVNGNGVVNAASSILLKQQYLGLPGPSGLGTDADVDGWVEPDFDNCPDLQNPDQADSDGDGVGNLCDNCLDRANPSQVDTPDFVVGRSDGFGNACDADWTDNGIVTAIDFSLLKQHYLHDNETGENENGVDVEISVDGSGFVNAAALTLFNEQEFGPPGPSGLGTDTDGDGWVAPGFDNCPDVPNNQADSDSDGIGDACDYGEEDDFGIVASGVGVTEKLLVDPSGNIHVFYDDDVHIFWLHEQESNWITETVYTKPPNAGAIGTLAVDAKSGGQLCAFWTEGTQTYRNLYGCIENGVIQPELLPAVDFAGSSALAHDIDGRPHVVAYIHGLYGVPPNQWNHYLWHTRFNGIQWTDPVNLPRPLEPGDWETASTGTGPDIVVDGGTVHVVHQVWDASTSAGELMHCDDLGHLAVATWDLTTGGFRPLHIAVQEVDPGLLGKAAWDLDASLDAAGEIHAVYRVDNAGPVPCAENPNLDPTERVFYATGPVLGDWQVTELEERPNLPPNYVAGLQISELVRDANGTVRVVSHASDDPQNIHLFSISGGNVSEQAIDLDTLSPIHNLHAAPRAGAQEPMIFVNQAATLLVREPPAP